MNGKERLDALFNNVKPDRVPLACITMGFSTKNAGYTVADAYSDPRKAFHANLWTAEQYGWDPAPQWFAHTVLAAYDFGGDVRMPTGMYEGAMIVKSYPVKTDTDVTNLKMPTPKTAGRIPLVMKFNKLQESHDLPVWFFCRTPFTMAANICGLDLFLRWLIKKPELCERLISMAITHAFNVLDYWVKTFGPEKISVWTGNPSESNQMISPKQFERFSIPYISDFYERLKTLGIKRTAFHCCGEQNLNLPYLADLSPWPHPSIISFGHEVDLDVAMKFFPDDIIYGNVEPALIQAGSAQQVYEFSRDAIKKGKKAPGGFILSAGCELPPFAPPINVFAMTKAVNELGWYK
jgi:uroporphyrinogen decarboxylase